MGQSIRSFFWPSLCSTMLHPQRGLFKVSPEMYVLNSVFLKILKKSSFKFQ